MAAAQGSIAKITKLENCESQAKKIQFTRNRDPPSKHDNERKWQHNQRRKHKWQRNDNSTFHCKAENDSILMGVDFNIDSELEKNTHKKQNFNHLLNFTLQRQCAENNLGVRTSVHRPIVHNKEQYLQANCKFVVKCDSDLKPFSANPKKLIDWNLIEQVQLDVFDNPLCPICIDVPISPRITKCGHIYCFHCILHLFSYEERRWAKCPICFDSILTSDLRSVSVNLQKQFHSGDIITLRLMRRRRDLFFPSPYSSINNSGIAHFEDTSLIRRYSKLLIANCKELIENIYLKDKNDLMDILSVETDITEIKFVSQALDSIKTKIAYLEANACENLSLEEVADGDDDYHYFYQSIDGQPIFLHPMNARCLVQEYGSLENGPTEITSQLIELEEYVMDADLTKRYKLLSHLPISTSYFFAEIYLRPPVVSKASLALFLEEIRERKEARAQKKRMERRRERKSKHIAQLQYNDKDFPCMLENDAFDIPKLDFPSHSESSNSPTEISSMPSSFANIAKNSMEKESVSSTPNDLQRSISLGDENAPVVPDFQFSFNEAFQNALDLDIAESVPPGKTKKKKPKTILFSTGMNIKR